jgi:hypothetical protein
MTTAADCGATAAAAVRYEGATAAECMSIDIPPQSPHLVGKEVTAARDSAPQSMSSWTALHSLIDDPAVLARARTIGRIFPAGIHGLDWMSEAVCGRGDPDAFHPDKQDAKAGIPAAKGICLTACPVLTACRAYVDRIEAETPRSTWAGVWAGETVRERAMRRKATTPEDHVDKLAGQGLTRGAAINRDARESIPNPRRLLLSGLDTVRGKNPPRKG